PHMVHPDNMSPGFCVLLVRDGYHYQEYNDAIAYEAEDKFNYGFTYVVKTDTDFTAFCFTICKSDRQFINVLLNQARIVQVLIEKLNNQLEVSFPELHKNKVDLITLKGDPFFRQRGIVFDG